MTLTEKLSRLLEKSISRADRIRASLLVLDWTGCAVAGRTEVAGQKIAAAFADETGACTRIGSRPASPQMAALHNGCFGNVLEMDDVDKRAVLHAAPTVIPAALAMSEHVGASREEFLDAVIIGYETTIRLGRAVGPGHYAFWHNTATCGAFGAAAAACSLLEGSDLISALGLAGTQSAGLWQTRHEPDSMAKQIHAGHAAQVGVQSALLSAKGVKGPRTILEGEQGFFAAMCRGANPENILKKYGEEWLIHQTSIKPYAACRHAHATIDAAKLVANYDGITPVLVETYGDALKFCNRPNPQTEIEAKFSLQYCVALILSGHNLGLASFSKDVISDPKVSSIRQVVDVKETKQFNEAYPAHYGAAIMIAGKRFIANDAYGDPEFPMSNQAIQDKANMLMAYSGMKTEDASLLGEAALNGDLKTFVSLLP